MIFSASYPCSSPEGGASQLVLTHNAEGRLLSFCWLIASQPVQIEPIVGGQIGEVFAPVELSAYLDTVQQVLATETAKRFSGEFYLGDRSFWLDLVISPVLLPDNAPTTVVVTGEGTATVPKNASN